MKNILKSIELLMLGSVVVMLSGSCQYQEIADAPFPEQKIYLPAARYGIFMIDKVATPVETVPTPGNAYRYLVDLPNGRFRVPLGVYRSGINNEGAFVVDVSVNIDTVSQLIAAGDKLPAGTQHLASDSYLMESAVEMKDGQELAPFSLDIDLDYLLANAPGNHFAIAVSIASSARQVNPDLSTVIVVIDTDMMVPTANFSASAPSDPKTWVFSNTSSMALEYSWDFGDGTPVVTEKNPTHIYDAPGTYTVTLTALGVAGGQNQSTHSIEITVL